MQSIYLNSSPIEKILKEQFSIPENIMMENAAASLETAVLKFNGPVFIICGAGNNGADGIALARRLFGKRKVFVHLIAEPKTEEAKNQFKCAKALGVSFVEEEEFLDRLALLQGGQTCIVDCLFGTGFHGQLPEHLSEIITKLNNTNSYKIACDISSGLEFNADETITMGVLKTALFSDKAKGVSGKISVTDLGIGNNAFERIISPDAFLVEACDMQLPWRTDLNSHKGTFGHACILAGEKSGAGILAATSALNFGAGLVSLVKTEKSNLGQFQISPELMICDLASLPEKMTAISIGSGLGSPSAETISVLKNWFSKSKKPACVIDADLFSYSDLPVLLEELNKTENGRIVLTPHLKEFASLCKLCNLGNLSVAELSENFDLRINLAKKLVEKFSNVTLVVKSSNTLICCNKDTFVCNDGAPSLAKGGSGDVLAGMITALLAQGYSSKAAAITAVEAHALAGSDFENKKSFDLTALKIAEKSKLL